MKILINKTGNYIAVALLLLLATASYAQYSPPTIYQQHNNSNYYPHEHDSATTVMPKLLKQNFLYFGFLSMLNQHISFEFAHQMSDDAMLCAQVGIISSGLSQQSNNSQVYGTTTAVAGGYFEGGVKLFLNPDYTKDGRHGYYTVEGLYLKPQFVVSIFSSTVTTVGYSPYAYPPPTNTQYSYAGGAVMLNLGGQWMIAHSLSIDAYAGAGVSFSNTNSSSLHFTDNYFSYLVAGQNFPLAVTGGVNIGLPF